MEITLEGRVSALEVQVTHLLESQPAAKTEIPWYKCWCGAFNGGEIYDSAMRLCAGYRRSLPTAAKEIEAPEKAGVHVPLPGGHGSCR